MFFGLDTENSGVLMEPNPVYQEIKKPRVLRRGGKILSTAATTTMTPAGSIKKCALLSAAGPKNIGIPEISMEFLAVILCFAILVIVEAQRCLIPPV